MDDPVMVQDLKDDQSVGGRLLGWRWIDKDAALWRGYVTFIRGPGVVYEHWLPGDRVQRLDAAD